MKKLSHRKKRYFIFSIGLVIAAICLAVFVFKYNSFQSPLLGVTFSKVYATQLDVDWKEAYSATVKDLKPDHIRIPVYWSDIEISEGEFDFRDYDWMLDMAQDEGVAVTLAIGQKVPRWPECFIPDWVDSYSESERQALVLEMLREVVSRYESNSAVVRWQVENEAFLQFGKCPAMKLGNVIEEIELVQSVSDKPITMTTSGEVEPWLHLAPYTDHVGFSLYRLTWNSVLGFWMYPLQPSFYRARIKTIDPFVDMVYVSELQAEPWFHQPIDTLDIEDQHQMFSPRMLRENVNFAKRLSVPLIDLWGVEWWWYMKENEDASLWNEAKVIFE